MEQQLLKCELAMYGINIEGDNATIMLRGSEPETMTIEAAIQYLRGKSRERIALFKEIWQELMAILQSPKSPLPINPANNTTQRMFTNAIQSTYEMACNISFCKQDKQNLRGILTSDVAEYPEELMSHGIQIFVVVEWLLHTLCSYRYRTRLLAYYLKHNNDLVTADVQGPWAHTDIAWRERVWSWAEDEEDFEQSAYKKQNQQRYQLPETYNVPDSIVPDGFFYRELRNDPYEFGDEDNDPYPHSPGFTTERPSRVRK